MPTDVLMPQMGESIAEGTIVRWLKSVGEPVDRDEPLFEISTDKVDAEVPAPAGGVLVRIRAEAGETVPVNSIVAVIGAAGEAVSAPGAGPPPAAAGDPPPVPVEALPPQRARDGRTPRIDPPPVPVEAPSPAGSADAVPAAPGPAPARARLSPVVRRLAAEHGVDLSAVAGTGDGGRITKSDVLAHAPRREPGGAAPADGGRGEAPGGDGARVEPMSVMRRRIAEHMIESRRTSAHVHTVFEVDFSAVAAARAACPDGTAPGYLAYVARAAAEALAATPVVNASVDGANVVHHPRVNLGIAVALDGGLIVPVVKDADRLDAAALDAAVKDLAARARAKRLAPEDVQGGTFTITNPGGFGSLLGTPIINQPQVAILAMGAVEPRPAVVDGAVVARLRAFLTLGFDHRLIDGAVADGFLARVKSALEDPRWTGDGGRS